MEKFRKYKGEGRQIIWKGETERGKRNSKTEIQKQKKEKKIARGKQKKRKVKKKDYRDSWAWIWQIWILKWWRRILFFSAWVFDGKPIAESNAHGFAEPSIKLLSKKSMEFVLFPFRGTSRSFYHTQLWWQTFEGPVTFTMGPFLYPLFKSA